MKTYKFKLSKVAALLSALAIILSLGGIALTVYRIIKIGFASFTVGVQHVVMLIVCVALLVVFISLLIRSYYKITDKEIILKFGVIKSVFKIEEITSVHLFTKTNKLVVYFKNETYTVIVVKENWHKDFIDDLLSKNDKIVYDVSYEESENDEKNDKTE